MEVESGYLLGVELESHAVHWFRWQLRRGSLECSQMGSYPPLIDIEFRSHDVVPEDVPYTTAPEVRLPLYRTLSVYSPTNSFTQAAEV